MIDEIPLLDHYLKINLCLTVNSLSKAVEDFHLTIVEGSRFLPEIPSVTPTPLLKDILKETIPWAIAVSSEKARSEVRYNLGRRITCCNSRIQPLKEKIELFLNLGTQVGILIAPDKLTVTVYRLNDRPLVLKDGDILTIPELFPGWELPISALWPPVFD